jgi:hypothetical protein
MALIMRGDELVVQAHDSAPTPKPLPTPIAAIRKDAR